MYNTKFEFILLMQGDVSLKHLLGKTHFKGKIQVQEK